MSVVEKHQTESSTQLKIEEVLIQLKETFDLKSGVIAERLGISQTYISSVTSGKKLGSRQLLAGLELLLELEELKLKQKPKSLEEQIEELREEIRIMRIGKFQPANTDAQPPSSSTALSPEEVRLVGVAETVPSHERPSRRRRH